MLTALQKYEKQHKHALSDLLAMDEKAFPCSPSPDDKKSNAQWQKNHKHPKGYKPAKTKA